MIFISQSTFAQNRWSIEFRPGVNYATQKLGEANLDVGFGWQAEVGFVIPLGENFQMMPSVPYRSLSRDIELENNTTTLNLKYVSAGLSIAWTF
jgi:hypothetical protein